MQGSWRCGGRGGVEEDSDGRVNKVCSWGALQGKPKRESLVLSTLWWHCFLLKQERDMIMFFQKSRPRDGGGVDEDRGKRDGEKYMESRMHLGLNDWILGRGREASPWQLNFFRLGNRQREVPILKQMGLIQIWWGDPGVPVSHPGGATHSEWWTHQTIAQQWDLGWEFGNYGDLWQLPISIPFIFSISGTELQSP